MNKFKVGDIYIFGKSSVPFIVQDIELIVADPTTEFHILRHYADMPDDYKKQGFTGSMIGAVDVEEALNTKGSKFFANVAGIETPKAVLVQIKKYLNNLIMSDSLIWVNRESYQTAALTFTYSKEVGYLGLINADVLTDEEKRRIKKVPRGNLESDARVLIQTISGVAKKPTKSIAVELTKVPSRPYLSVTAYPGFLSPDFPSLGQGEEEREYCKEFWNTHVFIE